MRTFFLLIFILLQGCSILFSQDIDYARKTINILAAPEMHGRGYVNKGDSLASAFLASEMQQIGLKSFKNSFFQPFNLSVNTLPGNLSLKADGKTLSPCDDYIVYTPSAAIKGTYPVVHISAKTSLKKINKLMKKGLTGKALLIDQRKHDEKTKEIFENARFYNLFKSEANLFLVNKKNPLSWGVYGSHLLLDFASIEIRDSALKKIPKKIELDIESRYFKQYATRNVVGYIEGSQYPDSFFVFTAHYDHLGRMGRDNLFPGAHDNASGTAMLLDLATYYINNRPPYSVAFIATAAEEAGLLGARHYVENPLFPLSNIKFLINLDMVSTGEEGMMVVNGEVFTKQYETLCSINTTGNYLPAIKSRGEAANSDHYPFYVKGVPCFYFYTLGGYSQYHNIYDIEKTLPMTAYNNMFRLVVRFVEQLSKNTD
ncbi:MAG: Aminopeptidase YwaD precursor [Bacteroidetes bacterium ADurb.Bin408]|nr:MAG: Aminopeptidase YwaD precursor [Bacteroidetes bacterium ADurb.Bin408]